MSWTQVDEWRLLVDRLPALTNAAWLEREVERVAVAVAADTSGGRRTRPVGHPLAELVFQVRLELQSWGQPEFKPTQAFARLGALAKAISVLSEASVEGLDERVGKLMSPDYVEFESTRFELDVALLHVTMKHEVRFVPQAASGRVPDLEINGEVEVECKHKVDLSQRDLAARELWQLLERRLYDELTGPGAYRVEFWTQGMPRREDVDWALDILRARRADRIRGSEIRVTDDEGGRQLHVRALDMVQEEGGVGVLQPSDATSLDEFDVAKLEIRAKLVQGVVQPYSAFEFGFRTDERKDWVEGVRRSLKRARSQFSGGRPAVAFVEVPMAGAKGPTSGLGALRDVVDDTFRSYSRLSAAVFAFTGWRVDVAGNGAAVAEYTVERNSSAVHALRDATTLLRKNALPGGDQQDAMTLALAVAIASSSFAV